MLKFALDRFHLPALLVQFILNLFTWQNNKILTHHGDTASYQVRVDIDQGEIIFLYFGLSTWILSLLDYSPLEFEQHSLPISHLTFMDDSTLIASSKSRIEDCLLITAKFYTLNNVQANLAKYVLLSSSHPSSLINFDLLPSPLVSNVSLSLSSLAFTRFMVKDMAALLGPKKLLAQHVAYFYNAILLLKLEFRLQTTLFSENTIQSIHAFYQFLSSHIASWQKIFTHPDFKGFGNYAISYLQASSCLLDESTKDYSFYPQ
ncbi:hypothetical protein RhiirA5_429918 [Rhizophagus irregularis]|uniref:Reverse transcriptase domain-containing protein n=1 Tax=Rhizophagus irregularis TaxID=588596 RepID=A0A2N0NXK4_9GLOM|nr:hypothetical protein RhiirA5_429918 [Rhizophagus irregularis]